MNTIGADDDVTLEFAAVPRNYLNAAVDFFDLFDTAVEVYVVLVLDLAVQHFQELQSI